MKLTEMIKLGSKGFKPADIKELETSGIQTEEVIKLAENGYSIADVKELIALAGTEEKTQPGNEDKGEPSGPKDEPAGSEGDDKLDYKKEFEALKTESDELKKKLTALQDQFASKPLSGKPEDPREKVQNIFRELY